MNPKPPDLLARLLYRDGLILIIDKPAGIAVHSGPGGGENLEQYFETLRFGLRRLPGLGHRLDRETSGCLVLGRHPKALRKLGKLFSEGLVEKTYWAIVQGTPADAEGRIEFSLRKETPKKGWRMVVDPDGQTAVTDYRVLGQANDLTWLELKPRTGRTHQIRVHCAALGFPVLGDGLYGLNSDQATRAKLHLHARAIALPLYPQRQPVTAVAAPPVHMLQALEACGYSRSAD